MYAFYLMISEIWIIGSSIIDWAGQKAAETQRPNLNLNVHIRWLGTRSMKWQRLRPKLQIESLCWSAPNMLLIHLGGNNIGNTNTGHLCRIMKRDLCYISQLLPDCIIVWSDILP